MDDGGEEDSQEEEMEMEQATAVPPSQQQQKSKKKTVKKNTGSGDQAEAGAQFPCLCCGENCRRNQQSVKCVMCALWAHKNCIKMSDTVFKALEAQQKETGTAYYVCRPCQSFAARIQHQLGEQNKKNEEVEKKVKENEEKINKNSSEISGLRDEMKKLSERMDTERENRDDRLMEEMQEREARRLNLVVHGVEEPPETVRVNSVRQEMDRSRCEELFRTMRARTKQEDLRFCRRIGEKGPNPRPMVIGLENEEEKRHILIRSRNLQGTRFQDISVVPDLTRKQRELEDKMRRDAEEKNKFLTSEDLANNLRWLVVGKRGEKRIIKGVERPMRGGGQFGRNGGLRGGQEWWRNGPGGQSTQQSQNADQGACHRGQGGWGGGGQPVVPQPSGSRDHDNSQPSSHNGTQIGGGSGGNYYNHQGDRWQGNNNQGQSGRGGHWTGTSGGSSRNGYRQENHRPGEQSQQDMSRWNGTGSASQPVTIDVMRNRADSRADKRPRDQDSYQEEEPARNRGRF